MRKCDRFIRNKVDSEMSQDDGENVYVSTPQCLTIDQAYGMLLNEYLLNESMNG